MDLSVPFFGNPNISRQGDKGRQNLKKEYEPSWLDSFLEGFFGDDAPAGSVLDPKADQKATAKDIGNRVGVVTDLAGPLKAGLLGALPALAGAIRVGGSKDLLLTHAFDPRNAPKIAESGFLSAPSLAITSNSPNNFAPSKPQFVFRAGSVTPEQHPSSLINRDGWFSNPTGLVDTFQGRDAFNFPKVKADWSDKQFLKSMKSEINVAKAKDVFHDDLRLGQYGSPFEYNPKALAIFASPKFESLPLFEKSPQGAPLLRNSSRAASDAWDASDEFAEELSRTLGGNPAQAIIEHLKAGKPLEYLPPDLQLLLKIQSRAPSDMAEFKIFDKLPLRPEDSFIYAGYKSLPQDMEGQKALLANLEPLQAEGFKVMTPATLAPAKIPGYLAKNPEALSQYLRIPNLERTLPRIAAPDGTFHFNRTRLSDPNTFTGREMLVEDGKNHLPYSVQTLMDDIQKQNFSAPKLGGSPPLSVMRPPVFSDETAAVAQKLLEKTGEYLGPETLRAAEFLHPGVLKKLDDPRYGDKPGFWDLAHVMGLSEHPNVPIELLELLRPAKQSFAMGEIPLLGPPAPPKLSAPPVGSWAHYKASIDNSKTELFDAADELHDIAEFHANGLKSIADQARFWEAAVGLGKIVQKDWAKYPDPHKTYEDMLQSVLFLMK